MSYQIHKRLIQTAAMTLLLMFCGVMEASAARLPFVVELDGAQAGTNSTATGTAAGMLDEETGIFLVRLQISPLNGVPDSIDYMASLTDDAGTVLAQVAMQTEQASELNEYTIVGFNRELLRTGRLRISVRSATFPNGEIAGAFKPFTAISGLIKGTYVETDNPAVNGFASVIHNSAMTELFFFYTYSGASDGFILQLDGANISTNARGADQDLVRVPLNVVGSNFFERLRTGLVSVYLGGRQGRAVLGPPNGQLDFVGNNFARPTVFRPSTGVFYWRDGQGRSHSVRWGSPGDVPVPADFDADGRSDLAIWRPSTGTFYVYTTETNTITSRRFGMNGDIPLTADYDGDGRADFGIYRRGANNGQSSFWILLSNGGMRLVGFGLGNDIPLKADFDGDLKTDIAVWRPSDGNFYSLDSSTGNWRQIQWGKNGDEPIVADYDGDAKSDYAVARKENGLLVWYRLLSRSNYTAYDISQWGIASAVPQPADYDGDGRADLSVFVGGDWATRSSTNGSITHTPYGLPSDIALF